MIQIRKSRERGETQIGWLDSKHTFSFADYWDTDFMGYRALRVINDDKVAPAGGFPTHPHRDMEILTWVLTGSLEHKDSMGTGSVIRPGDAQKMTAGTGIQHSEFNPSKTDAVHLLQIWIEPEKRGLKPTYEQKAFPVEARRGKLCLIGSRDGRDGSITIQQDVSVYATILGKDESVHHESAPDRFCWVQVAKGGITLNGQALAEGDGAAIAGEAKITMEGAGPSKNAAGLMDVGPAEVLLFDLA
jgi:redox-sensitive bicupin YhaK (pirin superfamily)